MKVAVVGAGTAGLLTAVDLVSNLPDFASVTLIHSLSIGTISVGESTLSEFPTTLSKGIDYNHVFDRKELNSTTKYGVQFKNWRDSGFTPFQGGTHGIHFDTKNLPEFVLPRLHDQHENFHELHGVVESIKSKGKKAVVNVDYYDHEFDYVVDCRGYPDNYEDYHRTPYVYLNSAIVIPSKTPGDWEYTYHIAHKHGWMFGIPLNNRTTWGYLYNSDISSKDECFDNIVKVFSDKSNTDDRFINYDLDNIKEFKFENYCAKKIFNEDGNIWLNGNRALFLEPLQATSIGCYSQISSYIIQYINDDIDLDLVQKSYTKLMDECILFINMHYKNGSDYDSELWTLAKEKSNEILSKHDMENYQWEFLIDTLQLRDSMFE